MEELDARKGGIQNKLDQLWLEKGMEPTEEVKLSMKSVDHIQSEENSLTDDNEPSSGCCYFRLRIKLGERIEKKIKDIVGLLEKGQMSDDSIAETVTKRGYTIPVTPLTEYETHRLILIKIWGFLLDDRVRRIGVWDMGGVGKTTIVTEINNRLLKESSHFNSIIWVKIPKDASFDKVQKDIAVKLGLTLSETHGEIARASKLLEAFNRRKKFVLILDDLWDSFSLESVGIPIPTVENGCKVVIIARLLRTCQAMETNEDVKVAVLSENEAWNLLRSKVGDKVLTSHAIQSIAMDVAKECGGLPLAVATVGLALRNITDTSQWENALAELRASSTGIDNMDEVVFSCLKLSYAKLKDDTRRSCFLFCALYPESHLIDANELINYWMWEGLLGGGNTIESKRKGKIILNELRYSCLLESETHNGVELIKVHDLIRDMAITIMRTKPRCIVNAGIGVAKPPHLDDWAEDLQRVSLMRNDLKSMSFKPRCPRLTCLLLQYNSFAKGISQDFFDNMQGLKVLDLSYTGICFLPVSLSNLENLCALLVSHCWNLLQVPSLAKLTKLKVLDFSFCRKLTKLPHGMENLANLKRLNFSSTCIENLPVGLISKFTLLEDLLVAGSPVIGVSSRAVKKKLFAVGIEELISCPMLSTLHMGFAEIEAFNEYARSGHCCQLKEYKLAVGYYFVDAPMLSEITSFAINGKLLNFMRNISPAKTGEYNEILEDTAALIPIDVMELIIDHCNGIKRLSTHFSDKKCLKRCGISFCDNMECILESEENNLSMLERMDLSNLKNLRMICGKPVRPCTLMNLKIINVVSCDLLRSLFPRQLMLELQNLEEISISYCPIMEEMIEGEEVNINNGGNNRAARVILPKLQRLMFYHIPKLRSIYNGVIVCNSLIAIEVDFCEALKRLPLGLFGVWTNHQVSSSPPALEKIKGREDWWESLEWDQPHARHLLQPYFVKRIQNSANGARDKYAPSNSNVV